MLLQQFAVLACGTRIRVLACMLTRNDLNQPFVPFLAMWEHDAADPATAAEPLLEQLLLPSSPASSFLAPWASLAVSSYTTPKHSASSLCFARASLERAYAQHTAAALTKLDKAICQLKLVISSLLFVPILTGHIQSTPLGKVLWGSYILFLAAHMALMALGPKLYQQQRGRVIIPLKLLLASTLASFVPTFVLKEVDSTASYMELVLLGGGLVLQLCTGGCGLGCMNTGSRAPATPASPGSMNQQPRRAASGSQGAGGVLGHLMLQPYPSLTAWQHERRVGCHAGLAVPCACILCFGGG